DELPDSDGVPMESEWVREQTSRYLIEPLQDYFAETGTVAFVGGNSFVYYEPVKAVGPDFYVVRGGVPRGQTKWVAWEEEGRLPTTVIELVSPSTESEDRGRKFCIYRDVFGTEDYFLYDPEREHLEGYHLERGHYVALSPGPDGRFPCASLGLFLGVKDGWLRFWTPEGRLLLTGHERADEERRRADEERRRADEERRRADEAERELERLRARLRELEGGAS
ncbi:MAG TPA: Uma2 family endonuclease, partial [Candidatus Nitrosotenuis sp.]|nr:Uma2 family endonuclease [Candidatus Nitrosotenuis sp.]